MSYGRKAVVSSTGDHAGTSDTSYYTEADSVCLPHWSSLQAPVARRVLAALSSSG